MIEEKTLENAPDTPWPMVLIDKKWTSTWASDGIRVLEASPPIPSPMPISPACLCKHPAAATKTAGCHGLNRGQKTLGSSFQVWP